MLNLKESKTLEGAVFSVLLEMKAADRYFLETGEQWNDLGTVEQRKLIEFEWEAIGQNH